MHEAVIEHSRGQGRKCGHRYKQNTWPTCHLLCNDKHVRYICQSNINVQASPARVNVRLWVDEAGQEYTPALTSQNTRASKNTPFTAAWMESVLPRIRWYTVIQRSCLGTRKIGRIGIYNFVLKTCAVSEAINLAVCISYRGRRCLEGIANWGNIFVCIHCAVKQFKK